MEITVNLTFIFYIIALIVLLFIVSRAFKDKLDNTKDIHFKDKDSDITNNLIAKYPNVSPDFINKSQKEQAIDNNNEIHEIRKELDNIKIILNGVVSGDR